MQFIVNGNAGDRVVNRLARVAISPFEKESFTTYREWEETLIKFMAEQSKKPNLVSWQKLITSEKTLETACFCAMVLANLIEYDFYEQSRNLFQIAEQLKVVKTHEFENWLRSGWLNLADVKDGLQATQYL